jgi:hypothetical protein
MPRFYRNGHLPWLLGVLSGKHSSGKATRRAEERRYLYVISCGLERAKIGVAAPRLEHRSTAIKHVVFPPQRDSRSPPPTTAWSVCPSSMEAGLR